MIQSLGFQFVGLKTIVLSSYLHSGIQICGFVVTWCMNQEKENQILSKFLLLGTTNDLDQLNFNKVHITTVHYHQISSGSFSLQKQTYKQTHSLARILLMGFEIKSYNIKNIYPVTQMGDPYH